MKTTRLQVRLRDVEPAVLRVIDVPSASTLPELHLLLQAAMGWTDSHLHQFVAGEARYGIPTQDGSDEQESDEQEKDERAVLLKDLPHSFTYLYDFGDGWEHDVRVIVAGAEQPGCPYGEGACPPEDCGGPGGYEELLAVLADPAHEDHEQMRAWAGELSDFDQEAADRAVRRTVGQVPESVRLLLELTEAGVKLTPGGRLPRALVRQAQAQRPRWATDGRPASLEEDLLPLAVLDDLLRLVGLLRLSHGVVRPTKVAGNDLEVVRRLRSVFNPDGFFTVVSEVAVAALAAYGPQLQNQLAGRVLPLLGPGWAVGDRPVDESDVSRELSRQSPTLEALDLVELDGRTWYAGPSARSLLARAGALADLWS